MQLRTLHVRSDRIARHGLQHSKACRCKRLVLRADTVGHEESVGKRMGRTWPEHQRRRFEPLRPSRILPLVFGVGLAQRHELCRALVRIRLEIGAVLWYDKEYGTLARHARHRYKAVLTADRRIDEGVGCGHGVQRHCTWVVHTHVFEHHRRAPCAYLHCCGTAVDQREPHTHAMAICCGGVVSLQRECLIGQCNLRCRKLADRQRRDRRHAGTLTGAHRHVRTRAGRRAHSQRHVSQASWNMCR